MQATAGLPRLAVLVAVGGAVGGLARWRLALALPPSGGLPVATLVTNAAGCLLLGALLARTADARLRALLGTGVLGGFTTVSTFALETDRLLVRAPGTALAYVVLSLATGVGAAALGRRLGSRMGRRMGRR